MNCSAPFPPNDPMLPSGSNVAPCPRCGQEHRTDFEGWCPVAEAQDARARGRIVVFLVVVFVGAVAVWVWRLVR